MPGPGLKEGFYLLKPFTIPFPKLSFAVTNKGVSQFGRRLAASDLDALAIDLLITDALAVDEYGTRLGDGLGFFDLSCAILAEHQALDVSHSNYAALDDETLLMPGPLPFDDWDVKMDGVILPTGVRDIANAGKKNYFIHWAQLPERRIKKIKPIWELRSGPTNSCLVSLDGLVKTNGMAK